jgi:S-formylglutathione hydrolase FrmB
MLAEPAQRTMSTRLRAAGQLRSAARRRVATLATGALVLAGAVIAPAAPASAITIGNLTAAVADDGARVIAETIIDSRTVDLTITSPAVGATTTRLLLPRDWWTAPASYWPTVYMLHGANEPQDYKSWTAFTDIETFTADKNVLVALPSDGPAGNYTDTYNPLNLPGVPKWETYHTVELPQLLQRGYRANGANAAAGLSIGGYGALIYAARHPGLYKAAASYSGLTDIFNYGALFSVTQSRLRAGEVYGPWGSAVLNRSNWVAHNPIDQAAKLRGTALYVSSGDGSPGPLDDPDFPDLAASRVIEKVTGQMNQKFVVRLQQLGVPVTANLYTGGYHFWNYWERELHSSWPMLASALGGPTAGPIAPAAPVVSTRSWWNAIFG